ncbi:hypothetical protein CDV36_004567 [Fusarium kuroshium]|uniref:Uncharacterized protein n=1 Tax=Fusarium kuroshium TaxID=2010991 RepID=A0A3M2SF14_9HYPO|nr:hypothetical protein CDV36_004567 [Fusarium kuroshium]
MTPSERAYICQAKAKEFKSRNQVGPEVLLRMKLENLRRMKHAFSTYETSFKDGEQDGLARLQKDATHWKAEVARLSSELDQAPRRTQENTPEKLLQEEPRKVGGSSNSGEGASGATKESVQTTGSAGKGATGTDKSAEADEKKLAEAEGKLETAKEGLQKKEREFKLKEETADKTLHEATKELYALENKVSEARKKLDNDDAADKSKFKKDLETAVAELEKGKGKWIEARRLLQAAQSRRAMAEMEMSGRENMTNSVKDHLSRPDEQIADIEAQLRDDSVHARGLPSAIIDIDGNRNIIHADESDMRHQQAPQAASEGSVPGSDAWSKIAFTVEAKIESTSTKERATSASIDFKAYGWFASVHADSSVSSASKKVQKDLSECTVDGSFSAILVTIRRPWLHAELFQDFDIDTPDDAKLSPGAAKIKTWIERGDGGSLSEKLADYGKFPAYPTSFIVAADTVLEFKSNESKSEELMSHLSTDSSIKANYGPWGLSGGASLKTDNKESSMKMEVRGGALRISFQAPQIIGWVSEILPQLPRQKGKIGGLSGPPNRLFRL